MDVDGQGIRETGGSTSDHIFFMKYPMSFLQHWYGTFTPVQKDTTTTGTSDVSLPSVGVHTDMSGESSSGVTQSKFPYLTPMKVVVFKYWTLVSDDLIPHGRNSGQYTDTFKCNIEVDGKVCWAERSLIHCKDKSVSTTNLITNVEAMSKKCASHSVVDGVLKDASPNYVNVNGEKQKVHTFAESFTHHVDLLWSHGGGLSWNMSARSISRRWRNNSKTKHVLGYRWTCGPTLILLSGNSMPVSS